MKKWNKPTVLSLDRKIKSGGSGSYVEYVYMCTANLSPSSAPTLVDLLYECYQDGYEDCYFNYAEGTECSVSACDGHCS